MRRRAAPRGRARRSARGLERLGALAPVGALVGAVIALVVAAPAPARADDAPPRTSTVALGAARTSSTADAPGPTGEGWPDGLLAEPWPAPEAAAEASGPRDLRVSARLRSTAFLDPTFDRTDLQIFEAWIEGRLELSAALSDTVEVRVAPTFWLAYGVAQDGAARAVGDVLVPEAALSWRGGPARLRVGTLLFQWGASDLVGPSDVLNPYDLRRGFVALPRELEIPQLAAELTLRAGPWALALVLQPLYTGSRFFLSGWDTGLTRVITAQGVPLPDLEEIYQRNALDRVGDQLLSWNPPGAGPADWTYAARLTADLEPLTLGASAVYGFEALPAVDLDPDLVRVTGAVFDAIGRGAPLPLGDLGFAEALGRVLAGAEQGRALFSGTYPRRGLLGVDASLALDPVVLKLDVALSLERTFYTQAFRPVRLPSVTGVVGVDYAYGTTLQLTVEAFAIGALDLPADTRIALFEPRPDAGGAGPAAAGRSLWLPGVSLVLRLAIVEGLALEAAALATATRGDFLLAPTLAWQLLDTQALRVGAVLVGGGRDGYGWTYAQDDRLLVQWTWAPL